jgi:hypothetical protein
MSPFSLSFTTLNAKAQSLPLESAYIVTSLSESGSLPNAGNTSLGLGKYLMMPSISG